MEESIKETEIEIKTHLKQQQQCDHDHPNVNDDDFHMIHGYITLVRMVMTMETLVIFCQLVQLIQMGKKV